MIMVNYWRYLNGIQYGADITNLVDTSGSTFLMSWSDVTGANIRMNDSTMGVILSNSTASVSERDYNIDGNINSNFTNISMNSSISATSDGIKRIYTITGINGSPNSQEIKRIGITKKLTGSGMGSGKIILFAVVDLTQSIVVNDNDSFTITLEWDEG